MGSFSLSNTSLVNESSSSSISREFASLVLFRGSFAGCRRKNNHPLNHTKTNQGSLGCYCLLHNGCYGIIRPANGAPAWSIGFWEPVLKIIVMLKRLSEAISQSNIEGNPLASESTARITPPVISTRIQSVSRKLSAFRSGVCVTT